MTLPATITTGSVWSDYKNAVAGPFESGSSLYAILVDKTANKLRCWRSTDEGHTWAEADSANAPASSPTPALKSAHVVQAGTSLYAIQTLSTTSVNILPFDCSANTWGTEITGPTITIAAGVGTPSRWPLFGVRRSDGSYVLAYGGATETVMGAARARVKISIRSAAGTWTGPFDVVGSANSPIANTLPGTALAYEVRALALGASDRVLICYQTGTLDDTLKCRVLTSSNAFATVVGIPGTGTGDYSGDQIRYLTGLPATYVDGSLTKVALPLRGATGTTLDLARCDTATAETAGNWSVETVVNATPEMDATNNSIVNTDGKKLWVWYAPENQGSLRYTDDAAAATWSDVRLFKGGGEVLVGGFSARRLSTAIGILYLDELDAPDVSQKAHDADHRVGYSDTGGENRAWQKFLAPSPGVAIGLSYIRVLARKVGSPGALTVRIYTDSAGSPSGTQVSSDSTIAASAVATFDEWQSFAFINPAITAGANYWIRVTAGDGTTNSTTNYYVVRINSSDVYADGAFGTGTAAGGFTAVSGKDLAFQVLTTAHGAAVRYDRLDIYTPKASLAVGATSQIIDLGATPPAFYEVVVDLGNNADPAGTVTIAVDGGWDAGALNPLSTDGPNAVQAVNSITVNTPPRFLRVTTVVESSASVIGVAGI